MKQFPSPENKDTPHLITTIYSLKTRVRYRLQVTILIPESLVKKVKIALVIPTFTAAAYDRSFYLFYNKYINVTSGVNITTDLNLLFSKVTEEPSSSASGFAMLYLLGNLKWISPESHIVAYWLYSRSRY